jgi:hypothetical protein
VSEPRDFAEWLLMEYDLGLSTHLNAPWDDYEPIHVSKTADELLEEYAKYCESQE